MKTRIERPKRVLTIREDAATGIVYAALSGVSTGERLALALSVPRVPERIRKRIFEREKSIERILTEYRAVLVEAEDPPDEVPSSWIASLIDDDERQLRPQSNSEQLRQPADRNGGFTQVSAFRRSFLCATNPAGCDFLKNVLEELQR